MTPPLPLYNPRSRQVSVVLMAGLLGTMLAFFLTLYLPGYGGTLAASDGRTVCVVASRRTTDESKESFAFTRSQDGSRFAEWNVRNGKPLAAAMAKGDLYCLFADRTIARFGEGKDNWQPLRFNLKWSPVGLVAFDDELWAIGYKRRSHEVLTARLEKDTWHDGPVCANQDDNVLTVRSVQVGQRRLLLWSAMSGEGEARKYRLAGAELMDNTSRPLPTLSLKEDSQFTAFARENSVEVYTWPTPTQEPAMPGEPIGLGHAMFEDDTWTKPATLDVSMGPEYAATEGEVVAHAEDKTFVYGFRYVAGLIYWGLYGVELQKSGASAPFLVHGPLPQEVQKSAGWLTLTMSVIFLLGGGLAGLMMLRRVESRIHPLIHAPYASVIDRALATSFDGMMIYTVMNLIPGGWSVGEFWVSWVLAFLAYCVFTEAAGGQTLGKKILGLRVLTVGGRPVTLLHAFRRNVLKPLEIITVGVGCCLVTSRFQRPGDFLGGTVVIKELRMPRHVEEGEESKP